MWGPQVGSRRALRLQVAACSALQGQPGWGAGAVLAAAAVVAAAAAAPGAAVVQEACHDAAVGGSAVVHGPRSCTGVAAGGLAPSLAASAAACAACGTHHNKSLAGRHTRRANPTLPCRTAVARTGGIRAPTKLPAAAQHIATVPPTPSPRYIYAEQHPPTPWRRHAGEQACPHHTALVELTEPPQQLHQPFQARTSPGRPGFSRNQRICSHCLVGVGPAQVVTVAAGAVAVAAAAVAGPEGVEPVAAAAMAGPAAVAGPAGGQVHVHVPFVHVFVQMCLCACKVILACVLCERACVLACICVCVLVCVCV